MFKLDQCSKTFGDCTAIYNVVLNKDYTVKSFIEEVLTKQEWGTIYIVMLNEIRPSKIHCVYSESTVTKYTDGMKELLDSDILKVSARGGWSRMDYNIKLK